MSTAPTILVLAGGHLPHDCRADGPEPKCTTRIGPFCDAIPRLLGVKKFSRKLYRWPVEALPSGLVAWPQSLVPSRTEPRQARRRRRPQSENTFAGR